MSELGLVLLLASARLWALLRVQASWRAVLGRRWEWIAAALALLLAGPLALTGRLAAPELDGLGSLVIALLFELLLGSVIGLAASLPGWALLGAARHSEHALELRGEEPGSLVALLVAASLAAALSLGLHGPLLGGLLATFQTFELGQALAWVPALQLDASSSGWLSERLASFTSLALALATPVLLTCTVIELSVASLGRVGFEAAALSSVIAAALRLAAALLALGAAWSAYPEAFARAL